MTHLTPAVFFIVLLLSVCKLMNFALRSCWAEMEFPCTIFRDVEGIVDEIWVGVLVTDLRGCSLDVTASAVG